jgi:LacI family transcriptional regulator
VAESKAATKRRPTLSDVARDAGVSLATASRVINGSAHVVGEVLRARVLRSAAALGYVANAQAQALARATTATVGVIVQDIADPYFTEIALGAMAVADRQQRLVTLCNTYGDPVREQRYVALLHAQRMPALVLAGSGHMEPSSDAALAAEVRSFEAGGGRVAMVGRYNIAADCVVPDNRDGAERLGRALIDLGHRRIGVITGPSDRTTAEDRLGGLADALAAGGAPLGPDRVVPGDFGREGGVRGMSALLDRNADLSAIVAPSDQAAIGALSVLRWRGISVPGDVSLFGFDDVPAARDVTPTLSTVRVPLRDLGAAAMRLALEGTTGGPRTLVLDTELILRDSSTRARDR